MHVYLAQTGGYSFGQIPDLPADFGPPVGDDGIDGLLVVSTAGSNTSKMNWRCAAVFSLVSSHCRHMKCAVEWLQHVLHQLDLAHCMS